MRGFVEDSNGYTNCLLAQIKEVSQANDHYYQIKFNENDPEHGLKSYNGEIVTLKLLEQLKILDNQYAVGTGYYKFHFEEVKN